MYKLLTPQNGEDRSFASAYAVNILKEITEYLGGKELVIPIKKYEFTLKSRRADL